MRLKLSVKLVKTENEKLTSAAKEKYSTFLTHTHYITSHHITLTLYGTISQVYDLQFKGTFKNGDSSKVLWFPQFIYKKGILEQTQIRPHLCSFFLKMIMVANYLPCLLSVYYLAQSLLH